MKGLITAIRTLTSIPVPGRDADELADSLFFFPLVGAFIGVITALVSWGMGGVLGWPLGAGVLCVAISTILTGGLHLDGLADVFDAMGVHGRERKLEIMKDPRVGTFGMVALVLCLLAKFISIARLSQFGQHWWIILAYVVSRTVQVEIAVWLPYARREGGTGRLIIEGAKPVHFLAAAALALVFCFVISGACGLLALVVGLAAGAVLARWMLRAFGGVTGDLLGMGSEVFETGLLLLLATGCPYLS